MGDERIGFHFDVMCPWAYQSSVWIREVRRLTGLQIDWRFFSLEEINRSVQSVEQDLDVIRAMGLRQRVLEGPLDYAPSNIDDPNEAPKPPGGTPAPTKPAPEAKPAPETKEP